MIKNVMLLIIIGFVVACQEIDKSKSLAPKVDKQPIKLREPAARCRVDTAAVLTNATLNHLLQEASVEKLIMHKSIDGIPTHVLRFLDCLAGGNFSITNPNTAWNSSCIFDDSLEDRQLAYLGVGKNITLLAYYTGGISMMKRVLIIKSTNSRIQDFWTGPLEFEAKTTSQIINSIDTQQNTDEAIKRIYFTEKYILNKVNTQLDSSSKESFIRTHLAI